MAGQNVVQELTSCVIVGAPFAIANTSSGGIAAATGAVTLGTALTATYSGGIWLWFPSTAFASSAAGWYWTVMSSSTAGVVYNITLGSQIPYIPTAAAVAAAGTAVGTGSGYTGSTSAETVTIPLNPNLLGACGYARITAAFGFTNNSDNKTTAIALGGTTVYTATNASIAGITAQVHMWNQAGQAINVCSASAANPFASGALQYDTISWASPTGVTPPNLTVTLTLATATDSCVCNGLTAEFFYNQ